MYTEEGFYDLAPGAIGTLFYKKNMCFHMSEEEKQAYVSRASNERMRMFLNNMTYGMNGTGPDNPADAYMKARRDSWGDLEDGNLGCETRDIQVQIGQKDSLEAIERLEAKEDFVGWLNPHFVEMIKQQFKNN